MEIIDAGTFYGVRPSTDLDLSSEALLGMIERNGVSAALTCSLKSIQFDARAGNDQALALSTTHSQLYPVATVDPRVWPDCLAEVERCAALGFVEGIYAGGATKATFDQINPRFEWVARSLGCSAWGALWRAAWIALLLVPAACTGRSGPTTAPPTPPPAVVTPTPDPINMGIVAAPLFLLYLLSIVMAFFAQRREEPAEPG